MAMRHCTLTEWLGLEGEHLLHDGPCRWLCGDVISYNAWAFLPYTHGIGTVAVGISSPHGAWELQGTVYRVALARSECSALETLPPPSLIPLWSSFTSSPSSFFSPSSTPFLLSFSSSSFPSSSPPFPSLLQAPPLPSLFSVPGFYCGVMLASHS